MSPSKVSICNLIFGMYKTKTYTEGLKRGAVEQFLERLTRK